jgi:hypothetical protein
MSTPHGDSAVSLIASGSEDPLDSLKSGETRVTEEVSGCESTESESAVLQHDKKQSLNSVDVAVSGEVFEPNDDMAANGGGTRTPVMSNNSDLIAGERIISTTPAVTPEHKKHAPVTELLPHSVDETAARLEPDTTLSLDQEEAVSDLEKSPPSDGEMAMKHKLLLQNDDEVSARADPDLTHHAEDSSDDDSSYFADPSHLPKPKSGRRFSWSSNTSLNSVSNVAQPQQQPNAQPGGPSSVARESDASLSLSDDTDDEPQKPRSRVKKQPAAFVPQPFPPGPPQEGYQQPPPQFYSQPPYAQPQPQQQQPQHMMYSKQPPSMYQQQPHQFIMPPRGGVPELYPQQIMPHMHSVSSLVSTSSQNSSASDASLQDELQNVAQQPQRTSSTIPSGRLVPIHGEHPPSRVGGTPVGLVFGSPSTVNLGPSPPTILQSYSGDGHITHPQPHTMTAEQLAAWAELATTQTAGAAATNEPRGRIPSTASAYSRESDLAYSGDSDAQQQQHSRGAQAVGFQELGKHDKRKSRDGRRAPLLPPGAVGDPGGGNHRELSNRSNDEGGFKVYWQRWLMLMVSETLRDYAFHSTTLTRVDACSTCQF